MTATIEKNMKLKWKAHGSVEDGGWTEGRAAGLTAKVAIHRLPPRKTSDGYRWQFGIYVGGSLKIKVSTYEAAKERAQAEIATWIDAERAQAEQRAAAAKKDEETREAARKYAADRREAAEEALKMARLVGMVEGATDTERALAALILKALG